MTTYEQNGKEYEVDYDLDNRIIKVDVDNDDVEYRYDALGRRVIRKEGTTTTALIWWGNSECAEHKHQAGQTVIQNDIMAHPSRLNSVIARAVDGSKFKLEWYHKNYLDHVYAVSDDSGDILEHYRYTAFGEVQIYNANGNQVSTTQIDNHILWNTRRRDELTGYYMYKFRHYSAELGRWPSRDPIEEKGGINLYGFVGNDPVGRWDELGLAITWTDSGGSSTWTPSEGNGSNSIPDPDYYDCSHDKFVTTTNSFEGIYDHYRIYSILINSPYTKASNRAAHHFTAGALKGQKLSKLVPGPRNFTANDQDISGFVFKCSNGCYSYDIDIEMIISFVSIDITESDRLTALAHEFNHIIALSERTSKVADFHNREGRERFSNKAEAQKAMVKKKSEIFDDVLKTRKLEKDHKKNHPNGDPSIFTPGATERPEWNSPNKPSWNKRDWIYQ